MPGPDDDDVPGSCSHFTHVLKKLVQEKIPGLPPGGGLAAKQAFLDKVYREFHPEHEDSSEQFDCSDIAEAVNN
uniref:Phosphatase 2C beta n=4 Tax=Pararge aegeria TaxID=116150 RepID=S4PF76_9NEOP